MVGILVLACSTVGCHRAEMGSSAPAPKTGTVRAALAQVPSGVQCIRLQSVSESETTVRDFDVRVGESTQELMLWGVTGSLTLSAEAFTQRCRDVLPSTAASHLTPEPVTVQVARGQNVSVVLRLVPQGGVTATVDFGLRFSSIGCGINATYLVDEAGTVLSTGENVSGQLAESPSGFRVSPQPIPGLADVAEVVGGIGHACARMRDGTVRCWGDNRLGQLGDGTFDTRYTPAQVPGLTDVTQITAGIYHTCAVSAYAGTAHCWGANLYGELGSPGGQPSPHVPVPTSPVPRLTTTRFATLSGGYFFTCGIPSNGSEIVCYGNNADDLPLGVVDPTATTALVLGTRASLRLSTGAARVASCAVEIGDDTTRCWGANDDGQLGLGTPGEAVAPPVIAPAELRGFELQAFGNNHGCIVNDVGYVLCAGSNRYGQIGHASSDMQAASAAVVLKSKGDGTFAKLEGVVDLCSGTSHSCALVDDGSVYCWGRNNLGQLGLGSLVNQFAAKRVVRTPPRPKPIYSADEFGAGAVQIRFHAEEGVTGGAIIEDQYEALYGVTFLNDLERDPTLIGAHPDYNVFNYDAEGANPPPGGTPLVWYFATPMRRVGVLTGGIPAAYLHEGTEAVLTALDGNGDVILSLRSGPLGSPIDRFLGIDADARAITEMRLNYVNPTTNPTTPEKIAEMYFQ